MKTVILAGGSGKRMRPVTDLYNKHLVLLYNKPLIFYPLSTAILSGSEKVLIVTNEADIKHFQKLLGNGRRLGIHIEYEAQDNPNGIADAVKKARSFIGDDDFCLMLGDNVFLSDYIPSRLDSRFSSTQELERAVVFLYQVRDARHYGVATVKEDKLSTLEEKPSRPMTNLAVTGVYVYPNYALELIDSLEPSCRGELEITDLNKRLLKSNNLDYEILAPDSGWFDCGRPKAMLEASKEVARVEYLSESLVGCPYEASWRTGKAEKQEILRFVDTLPKYSEYRTLLEITID